MWDEMTRNAIGAYAIDTQNRQRLGGFVFQRTTHNKQFGAEVFIFNDPYRKVNVDLLFTGNGGLYISDVYGETMNRDELFYIKYENDTRKDV